jgi:hypothetical protein
MGNVGFLRSTSICNLSVSHERCFMSDRTYVLRRVVFLLVGCGLIAVGGCAGCDPIFKFSAGDDVTTTVGTPIVLEPFLDNIPHDIQWSPTSNLSNPKSDTPTFTASQVGDYPFTITVVYHAGGIFGDVTLNDTVVVHVTGSQGPIFANAGPDLLAPLNVATTLQGAVSGGNGVYTVAWTPTAGLSDPSVAQPTFTPTITGDTVFTLTVTDSEGSTATDSVTVTAFGTRLSGLVWQPNATAGYQLLATFDGDLDPDTAQTASNYRDHASNTPATSAVLQADQRSVLITFTTVALARASTFDIGVGGGLKDSEGFGILAVADRTATQNPADQTSPTITSLVWAANATEYKVLITFDEVLDRQSATTTTNYLLQGNDGDDPENPTSASLDAMGRLVTLTFGMTMGGFDSVDRFSASVTILDINGRTNASVSSLSVDPNPADTTGPIVAGFSRVDATHADITFSEVMDKENAQRAPFYTMHGGDAQVIAAVLRADGRTVRLTTDADPTGTTATISTFVHDINVQAPAAPLTAGPF